MQPEYAMKVVCTASVRWRELELRISNVKGVDEDLSIEVGVWLIRLRGATNDVIGFCHSYSISKERDKADCDTPEE